MATFTVPRVIADTFANRPAAADVGHNVIFVATDTGAIYWTEGANWTAVTAIDTTVVHLAGTEAVTGAKTFSGGVTVTTADVTITDRNVALSATTGTKLGTATTQKLGFYNATPVVQPLGTDDIATLLATLGLRASGATPPATLGATTTTTLGATAITATSLAATAAVTSSGATSGVGYATGAGGAVAQITSSATGVTLNKASGQVTTVALTTAAGAEEQFTVTNSVVAATDVVVVSTTYAGAGTPMVTTTKTAAGAFDVLITNLHASAALNAAVVINFAVIKAVAA